MPCIKICKISCSSQFLFQQGSVIMDVFSGIIDDYDSQKGGPVKYFGLIFAPTIMIYKQ